MKNFPNFSLKPNTALFIDRDGVCNKLLKDDYVKKISEFELLEEVIPALEILKPRFHKIFIVTNQQGIGKGLMLDTIETIHAHFLGLIPSYLHPDKIYHCPHLKEINCLCRKPKPGMALMAKNDYPNINLSNSIMVGDSLSDMEFALNGGMKPVFISKIIHEKFQTFDSILTFAQSLLQ
jgi:histidinol-phosphate phosphatase family protein